MKKFSLNTLALVCAAALTGCGDAETNITELEPTIIIEDDDDHDHDHDEEVGEGRLAITAADQAVIYVYDLEDNSLIDSLNLTHPAEYLYASPENRYAVSIQRTLDSVEFVDGGLWQELHDDHYDQHDDAPVLTNFTINDSKPTHYVQRGEQTAIYFDGDGDSGINARLSILSDESIAEETTIADHDFDTNIHGTAEIRNNYVLTTLRDSDSDSTLPEYVALLELHDDHFHQEEIFDISCPALHGSFQTETHIAFGCSDGVLSIEQQGNVFTPQKIANPAELATGSRIGALYGSPESNIMIGTASSDFYFVDLTSANITPFDWQTEDNLTSVVYSFDGHKEHMLILDNEGYLNLYSAEDDWTFEKRILVIEDLATDADPIIVSSKAGEVIYIINDQQVTSVDLDDEHVEEILTLDFAPSGAVWLGIAEEEEHDH
jgi:hypothetical protein